MAGLAVGYWKSVEELAANWKVDHRFEPQMPEREAADLLAHWAEAVGRAKAWIPKDAVPVQT